jgi:hypothetical protein
MYPIFPRIDVYEVPCDVHAIGEQHTIAVCEITPKDRSRDTQVAGGEFEPTIITFSLSRNDDGNCALCVGRSTRIVRINPPFQKEPKINGVQESAPLLGKNVIKDPFV